MRLQRRSTKVLLGLQSYLLVPKNAFILSDWNFYDSTHFCILNLDTYQAWASSNYILIWQSVRILLETLRSGVIKNQYDEASNYLWVVTVYWLCSITDLYVFMTLASPKEGDGRKTRNIFKRIIRYGHKKVSTKFFLDFCFVSIIWSARDILRPLLCLKFHF